MNTCCQSCADRDCCVARAVTERESIFAWVDGLSLDCEDYKAEAYHGIEGVRA